MDSVFFLWIHTFTLNHKPFRIFLYDGRYYAYYGFIFQTKYHLCLWARTQALNPLGPRQPQCGHQILSLLRICSLQIILEITKVGGCKGNVSSSNAKTSSNLIL